MKQRKRSGSRSVRRNSTKTQKAFYIRRQEYRDCLDRRKDKSRGA